MLVIQREQQLKLAPNSQAVGEVSRSNSVEKQGEKVRRKDIVLVIVRVMKRLQSKLDSRSE